MDACRMEQSILLSMHKVKMKDVYFSFLHSLFSHSSRWIGTNIQKKGNGSLVNPYTVN